jgi:hypothetical protein
MDLIQYQIDSLRNAARFYSTRWKQRRRTITSSDYTNQVTQTSFEQQERDRDDDREMERDYYPDQEPEQGPPEYPFQDFNYGP